MVPLMSLWLPIVLSAAFVFIASSIIHMLLRYHRHDFTKLPNEDAVMAALRPLDIPPGDYMMPNAQSMKEMKDPAFLEKFHKGPVAMLTVMRGGSMSMGKNLAGWFIYCLVVSIFAAYIAGRALPPGSPYLQVHRFAGATAFVGYVLASWQSSVWYKRKWTTNVRNTIDGLIYGFLTGGTFGAFWPK